MRPQVSWTTEPERELLIEQALQLLETVGMRFGPSASLEALAEAEARVDRASGVARIPRALVERALALCPREVLLAGASEADDVLYGGIQAGYEKALKGLAVSQSGADLITGGVGMLHGAGLFSLPQVVVDGEIVDMIQRLLRGADVSRESVMNEVTARVGFDGDFLRQKETSRRLRAGEVYQPEIATRATIEAWERAGRDELDRARERARDIVAAAEERGPVLAAATGEALRAIAAEALAASRPA